MAMICKERILNAIAAENIGLIMAYMRNRQEDLERVCY